MNSSEEIEQIRERNKRVELDKKWETSMTRRISIAVFTYVVATSWLLIIENQKAFLNALIPTGGYILSTLSLPFIQGLWKKYHE